MVGNEDPDVAIRQLADDALDIEHGQRVDAREGLIEQHEARFGGERPRDLDTAPLAPREGQAETLAHVADAQLLQQLLEPPLTGGSLNPARAFGPALVSHHWGDAGKWLLVYVLSPGVGAVVAAAGYFWLFIQPGKKGVTGTEPVG